MRKIPTSIPGLFLIEPQIFKDERGHFFEAYHRQKLADLGITDPLIQENHSFSKAGVLRGMHFQRHPHAQSKLLRCIRGAVYDAVIDLREGSPTYGKWYGAELSAENRMMLFVPVGFAHGFYALEDAEVMYLCGNAHWHKESEGGIRYDDPSVGIQWPLKGTPIVHVRDQAFGGLETVQRFFTFTITT